MSPLRTETVASESPSSLCREVSDEIVLEHVRAGNTALYEVLVLRYNPCLRRMARRVLSNEADVDDVIQEAHFNAFRAIKQFEGKSSFRTWLTRITLHAALSRLRRPERRRELSTKCAEYDPLETVVSVQRDPEQQLQDKETMETLEAAVRCLPEPYRTAFFLHWVRDLSTAELAVSLEITESCAKTRLHRARRLLYGLLRNGWRSAAGCAAG
jgi:RNA polymerase sigma-70 factor (ECF subfamily)